jgi:hypothetical protein
MSFHRLSTEERESRSFTHGEFPMGNPANLEADDEKATEVPRVSGVHRLAVVVSQEEVERGLPTHHAGKYDRLVVHPAETIDVFGAVEEILISTIGVANEDDAEEDLDDESSVERILDLAYGVEGDSLAESAPSSQAHEDFATYHLISRARERLALEFLESRLVRRCTFAQDESGSTVLDLFAQHVDAQAGLERLMRSNELDCSWLNNRIISLLRRAGIPERHNTPMFRRLGKEPCLSSAGILWLAELRKRIRRRHAERRYAFRETTRPLRAQLGDSILDRALEERGQLRRVDAWFRWDGERGKGSLPDAVSPRSLRRALLHMPPPGWRPDPALIGQPTEFSSPILMMLIHEIRMDLLGREDPAAVRLATELFKLRGIYPVPPP